MDVHELQAFVAVTEYGSFSIAAENLFLTQPAVSKRVSTLEMGLGVALFDRIGRRIRLTGAGKTLLPRAKQILLDIEDATRSLSNLSEEVSGTLTVGTSHHIGLHRLPPVLRQFSERFPAVQLDMKFIDSEEAYEGVLHGSLELGIVTLPPEPQRSVETEKIWHDPLCFVISPEHALANNTTVAALELAQHTAILPSFQTFTRRIVEEKFREQKLVIDVAMSTNYLETIHMMVSIGLGWSVLPESLLNEQVLKLNVEDMSFARSLGVVYHSNRTLSNAAKRMLELLRENGEG